MNPTLNWIIMEIPCVYWFFILLNKYWESPCLYVPQNMIVLGVFILHYINRSIIYPFRLKNAKPWPFWIFAFGFCFTNFNGYLQSVVHLDPNQCPRDFNLLQNLRFLCGIVIFFVGFYINQQSDDILRNLRKPGEGDYKIPKGGMFEYVSSANFFGEMVEWFGYAIASGTLAALTFAIWTFCNLLPRGIHHHIWYKKKFDDYPKERKAVLPLLI